MLQRRSGGRWRLITADLDEHLFPSSANTAASIAAIVNSSNFLELPMAVYTYLCNILMPTSLSPAEAVLQKCSSIKPVRPAPPPREQILEGGHSWEPGLPLSLASLYGLSAEEALHLSNRYGDVGPSLAARIGVCKSGGVSQPVLEAEVEHAVEREIAGSVKSVVARLGVVGEEEVHVVGGVMATSQGWDPKRREKEVKE